MSLFFLTWDVIFTKNGVWGFNSTYITGYYFVNLPIEEILFFVCIPYACVFTHYTLNKMLNTKMIPGLNNFIITFAIALIVLSLFFYDKSYTSVTFFLTGIYLSFLMVKKVNLFPFFRSYFPLLIPFFISNGLLTGSFLESPVVWYNDAENLGLRIFTIPIEDTIYMLLMLAININLMEYFEKNWTKVEL